MGKDCQSNSPPKLEISGPSHTLTCPLHDASFDLKTGLPVRGPCSGNLDIFKSEVDDDGNVWITDKQGVDSDQAKPGNFGGSLNVAIVGGGAAGAAAIASLRAQGFEGKIHLISKEFVLPYDRPLLSKAGRLSLDDVLLKGISDTRNFQAFLGWEVIEVQPDHLTMKKGQNIEKLFFDAALVCTGAEPRDIAALKGPNIFQLRSWADAEAIRAAVSKSLSSLSIFSSKESPPSILIIGSSFLGLETAASIASIAPLATVTVVGLEEVPMERVFGKPIGRVIKKLMEQKGIKFITGSVSEGSENSVTLGNGEKIKFDMAVLAIGVKPTVPIIHGALRSTDGSVVVDSSLKASGPIFAAGDCVTLPLPRGMGRIEHWNSAMDQGRLAAQGIANYLRKQEEDTLTELKSAPIPCPFFWSSLFGQTVRFCGHLGRWEELIVEGDLEAGNFIAFYIDKDDMVAGVVGMGDFGDQMMPVAGFLMNRQWSLETNQTGENIMPRGSDLKKSNSPCKIIQGLVHGRTQ